uniref:C-type lectin domain-containing protein n=1 Tax=Amphilophus citrinellus TaxID=61819 RepID=A0A3Q0RMA1_AMPCI
SCPDLDSATPELSFCTSLHFYTEPKSWNDALEHCQTQNSSLVQITNETVKDDVYLVWQDDNSSQAGVWIGLERSIFGNNPEWKWISGSKLMHSQLNSSFPVNPLNNHCGKIIIDDESEEFKWQDADCHNFWFQTPCLCKTQNR